MSHEIESLVHAIESLKQEPNPFKDFMIPVFSSLLGFIVAYFTLRYQENIQAQKERINAVNDWVLLAEGLISSLVSIKANYHGKLEKNPFQRTLQTQSLVHSTKKVDKNLSSLSFIIPRKNDKDSQNIKWRELPRIRAMIENYNLIIELWNKRNETERPIKEKILSDNTKLAYAEVSPEQIFKSVSASEFSVLVDLTERAIKYTDDIIVEINDFMSNFPEIGKSLIKKRYRDTYGPIITFSADGNPRLLGLIEKTPEVDYAALAELFGKSEEQVRNEYITGYE